MSACEEIDEGHRFARKEAGLGVVPLHAIGSPDMLGIMDSGELALVELSSGISPKRIMESKLPAVVQPVRDRVDQLARQCRLLAQSCRAGISAMRSAIEGKADLC